MAEEIYQSNLKNAAGGEMPSCHICAKGKMIGRHKLIWGNDLWRITGKTGCERTGYERKVGVN